MIKNMGDREKKTKPGRHRLKTPFASNLKAVLEEREISSSAAAEICGVSKTAVHAWLNGGAPQDLDAVAKLCNALKVDFQWLLTGSRSQGNLKGAPLSELFEIHDDPAFSGLFMIEAKRLKRRE